MWEAIERNKRRSWMLIGAMGVLLAALGYVVGAVIYVQISSASSDFELIARTYRPVQDPDQLHNLDQNIQGPLEGNAWSAYLNRGGGIGAAVAAGVWLVLTLVALGSGDAILLKSVGAYPVQKEQVPRLWNVVEEMSIAAGLGSVPRVCIVEDDAPNAFAVGRRPEQASVAVTSGLLKRLSRDELQGVVAHEIGHIRNLDVRFMTIATVLLGSIVVVSEFFIRYLWYGGGGRRASSGRGGRKAAVVVAVVGLLFAVLAPLVARILYFACSRRREYLADASAALFTRYPEGLAAALERIAVEPLGRRHVSRTLAPLYIVNPLQGPYALGWFSTHPSTEKRIEILRGMGGGAGYADYERAYRRVHGERRHCLGDRTLAGAERVAVRSASPEPPPQRQEAVERARAVAGILDRVGQIIPIACSCGATLKIPPLFGQAGLNCPRCGRAHEVPAARIAGGESGGQAGHTRPTYKRQGAGWESFKCTCGGVVQISPSFAAKFASCRKCGRHIGIT